MSDPDRAEALRNAYRAACVAYLNAVFAGKHWSLIQRLGDEVIRSSHEWHYRSKAHG